MEERKREVKKRVTMDRREKERVKKRKKNNGINGKGERK